MLNLQLFHIHFTPSSYAAKSVLRPKNLSSCLVTAASDDFVPKTELLSNNVMSRVHCCFDARFGLIFHCQSGS